ncbi:MAG: hypothetical protein GY751_18825 [Bacteroidetes bacterium]|nr:hypothetical protein [Bacteroidota bacterium]
MLFIGIFMTLVISAKMNRDQQVVSDLTIDIDHTSGNFFITEQDVRASINEILPDSGSMLHTKDLKELENKLDNIPQIGHSNVFVNNTGQLSIEVIQRSPLYRMIRANGTSYYVDAGGYKFPVSDKYTARVPVVTGFIADNGENVGLIGSDLGYELHELFTALDKDPLWKAQFGQVDITSKGELELIPRVGRHVVQIGNTSGLEDKLKRLKVFYMEGLTRAGWDTYKTINVKYKDQVVCKK